MANIVSCNINDKTFMLKTDVRQAILDKANRDEKKPVTLAKAPWE